MKRALIAVLAIPAVAGCANNAAMRDLSARTAAQIATYRDQQAAFNSGAAIADTAHDEELSVTRGLADGEKLQTDAVIGAWTYVSDSKNKERLASYALATSVAADAILPATPASTVATAAPDDATGKALDAASAALVKLSANPSSWDQFVSLYAFAGAVNDSLSQLKANAAKDPAAAAVKR